MIRNRTFVWAITESGPGWLPKDAVGIEGWYSGKGFLSAHDVLDHLSDKADWAHELRATGASVFAVAGIKDRTIASIAEDVVRFAASHDHGFQVPDAPARWAKPLANARHEAAVQRFGKEAATLIANGTERAVQHGMPKAYAERAKVFVERALPWVRVGYAAAARVYGDRHRAAGVLHDDLRDAINNDIDDNYPEPGEELVVRADTKAMTFSIKRSNAKNLAKDVRERHRLFDGILGHLMGVPA